MSDKYKVFCWVQGDKPGWMFSVKVGKDEAVSDLKEAIFNKNVGKDAISLEVYKVSALIRRGWMRSPDVY